MASHHAMVRSQPLKICAKALRQPSAERLLSTGIITLIRRGLPADHAGSGRIDHPIVDGCTVSGKAIARKHQSRSLRGRQAVQLVLVLQVDAGSGVAPNGEGYLLALDSDDATSGNETVDSVRVVRICEFSS
jgi:hypothetical protein